MLIAGFQKLSLVDFPGDLSSVVFVQGCNFHCGYCHNPELIERKTVQDPAYTKNGILDFLVRRKAVIEGLVITGGEPVIYPDLPEFIEKVKAIGIKVKLDTNGSDPAGIAGLLGAERIDYIALDVKTSFGKYPALAGIDNIGELVSESIKAIMASAVPYEFRTTCVPGIVDEEDIMAIGGYVKGASQYYLQEFRPEKTFVPSFRQVKPYSRETLEKFRDILARSCRSVEIRGV